jgi:hypothetical protein
MTKNSARTPFGLAVGFILAVAGCGDRRVPVGWWHLGGASGMNPPPAGMGAGGAAGGPSDAGGPVATCTMPAPMPARPLVTPGPEMGRRLARLLWRSEPDGPLQMAATTLRTTADVAALARDMLQDSRSGVGLAALTKTWLRTDEALTVAARAGAGTAATPQLRASMVGETERFVQDLIVKGGSLTRLLTASDSFVDRALGDLYGIAGPATGFAQVMMNPAERSGVLTNAGTLFAHPFATHRGAFIRDALMCQPLPPPPPTVNAPIAVPAGQTYREALDKQLDSPACMACHRLSDSLGFALEHYDVLGRYRATENGKPIDSSTTVQDLDNVAVDGARELGEELAASCQVKTCTAHTFLAHALGRPVAEVDEAESIDALRAFAASNYDLKELLLATVQSNAFIKP